MACVLTVVVVDDGRAIVGHVGDTRLYKLRDGRIDKVTRDHSPVGEREDSQGDLRARGDAPSAGAMRCIATSVPTPHEPGDPGFVDLHEIPFEPDAALLLCSDGLTDLIDSSAIQQIVERSAGRPQQVVKGLIDAANAAGGKDNVSAVYVEGERFAASAGAREQTAPRRRTTTQPGRSTGVDRAAGGGDRGRHVRLAAVLAARPGPGDRLAAVERAVPSRSEKASRSARRCSAPGRDRPSSLSPANTGRRWR